MNQLLHQKIRAACAFDEDAHYECCLELAAASGKKFESEAELKMLKFVIEAKKQENTRLLPAITALLQLNEEMEKALGACEVFRVPGDFKHYDNNDTVEALTKEIARQQNILKQAIAANRERLEKLVGGGK